MFKDFKEIAKKSNALENLVWLCTIKESEKFNTNWCSRNRQDILCRRNSKSYECRG